MNIRLTEWHARYILEALEELEAKWHCINKTAEDEDMQADYGNDLIELGMTKDHVREAAVKAFGPSVTTFDRSLV